MGKFAGDEVVYGKMALWRTKAAIFLKRVKWRKSYYGGPIGTHQRSFERYTIPVPDPYGLPFLEIVGLELSYPLFSQEQAKLRPSNLAGTFTGLIRIKAH